MTKEFVRFTWLLDFTIVKYFLFSGYLSHWLVGRLSMPGWKIPCRICYANRSLHFHFRFLVTRDSDVTYEIASVHSFLRSSVRPSVNHFFSGLTPQIFLIFCMKLIIHRGLVTVEPDFWKKISLPRILLKTVENSQNFRFFRIFQKNFISFFL